MMTRIPLWSTVCLLVAVLVVGCGATPEGLWSQRPVVELSYAVDEDLRTVTGRERVEFTPDRRVCELVFRTWPNKPTAAWAGTSMVVTEAVLDGRPAAPVVLPAGAPGEAPGTLVELPLPGCRGPGESVTVELGFRLALGEDAGERFGYSTGPDMAWFATGFPLLAWVRGQGWAREEAVALPGETATSEDFELASLEVTVPSEFEVLGVGTAAGTEPGPTPETTVHLFEAEAVRNVAVTVGDFEVVEHEISGVRLHLATPEPSTSRAGARISSQGWADELAGTLEELEQLLGPYPYRDLWVTIVPALSDGIEFPTALLFGDVQRRQVESLVAHELAHQWFYSSVGNNQARHPWIDESFATFAQAVVAGQQRSYELSEVSDDVAGKLGAPMEYWAATGGYEHYVAGVYSQGAAVLLEARRRVGPEHFDAALRTYLEEQAHRVAGPRDVAEAFRDLPEVRDLFDEYGILEEGDR